MVNGSPLNSLPKQCLDYCQNDGVCVIKDNNPQCYCLPKWTGERCQLIRPYEPIRINDFLAMSKISIRTPACTIISAPICQNSGLCQFQNNRYSCACPDSHFGPLCEYSSPCTSFCQNDGICSLDNLYNPKCDCTGTGYRGLVCHIPAPITFVQPQTNVIQVAPSGVTCAQNPCRNGRCYNTGNSYFCSCNAQYTGVNCDISSTG